jgi:heptosyltransferase-1
MKCLLVVRLGAMGDIIHTLPAAASLRQSFAGARLFWLVESRWQPLLAGNPFIDEVLVLDRGSLAGLWSSLRRLRAQRYDLAVDFQGLIKSALPALLAQPERLYGYHRSQVREKLAAFTYSHPVKVAAAHIVDRHQELAAAAGATSRARVFPLPAGTPEGDLPRGPYVLASPLAGWTSKQWPLERYEELARKLSPVGLPLVLNISPAAARDLPRLGSVVVHMSGLPGLIDATRRAVAVVGVDSGPLHLAAALERPGVAIYGPTDPARNGPYGNTFTVLRSASAVTSYKRQPVVDPSMAAITADEVLEALKERLR